ncbi:hypothetical protein ABW19_dt0209215 [Dactylella cylindrospora]|nr:hypothetical protein ABW19_dt0209215 [Dactylella cylindrospora]
MASEVPPSMKVIAPFIVKAHQMEKADPVISYFCYVYVVQQALSKGLTKSAEGMAYTAHVMDTLEQRKIDLADNEAVTDDLVGKVYVEQFANKIFTNAENAQNARRCTKQTAETFMAASIFFELLRVFGEQLEPEVSKKIVFAKYSASRILKALKAGEDPNPPVEEQAVEEEPPVFTDEAPKPYEVSPISPVFPHPPAPTVEDAMDESASVERAMARMSTADESLHPSRMMTPAAAPLPPSFPSPPETEAPHHHAHIGRQETMSTSEPFPTPPPQPPSTGYFPSVPYTPQETSVVSPSLELPSAPSLLPSAPSFPPSVPSFSQSAPSFSPSIPSLPPKSPPTLFTPPQPQAPPENFYGGVAAGGGVGVGQQSPGNLLGGSPAPNWLGHAPPPRPPVPQMSPQPGELNPNLPPNLPPNIPQYSRQPPPMQAYIQPSQQPAQFSRETLTAHPPPQAYAPAARKLINPDDDPAAVKKAQKHMTWAASALNFDDVPTAVAQLRLALQTLGAE